jgi:AraC family transcriptional regulator, transcriptional activator of pobA
MVEKIGIPVYGLEKFKLNDDKSSLYQVELFDANRHFEVAYPHRHDFYEILYLSKGSGFHIIDSNKYAIKPPCIFFLSPGQAHRLELSNDIDGFIFIFTAEFYLLNQKNKNKLLEFPFFFSVDQVNPPIYLNSYEDDNFIKNLFARCINVLSKNKVSSDEIARSALDLILLTCNDLYPEEMKSVQKGKGYILVKNFLLLIEENFHKNLRISDYADLLAITPNHLTQMVKQVTGKPSVNILHEKTVVEIKRLLIHTDHSIAEISDYMNFPDQSYFTKYFKKLSNLSPMAYRKLYVK